MPRTSLLPGSWPAGRVQQLGLAANAWDITAQCQLCSLHTGVYGLRLSKQPPTKHQCLVCWGSS